MKREPRDWEGYENNNWKVHKRATFCKSQRKWLWIIECKHCGDKKQRRIICLERSVSCGCKRPPPPNKGTSKMDESDKVVGYWLLRKPWAIGARMESAA